MSLFSRRQDPNTVATASVGFSVLDAQMIVHGDIETEGSLRIDGKMEGSIIRADVVVLGKDASIVGDITAREVIIGGIVHGNIRASSRAELLESATVEGDIDAAVIRIHEGGSVQGRLAVQPVAETERLTSGAPRLAVVNEG
jgi:cytoskeletal protein CcmA (bactofilin family)